MSLSCGSLKLIAPNDKKKGGCRSKGSKSILQRDLVALIRKRNCRQISKSTPLILSVFRICNFQQKLEETLVFPFSSLKLDAPPSSPHQWFHLLQRSESLLSNSGNPGVGIDSNSCVNLDDIYQSSIMDGQVATNHFNMKKKSNIKNRFYQFSDIFDWLSWQPVSEGN